MIIIEIKWFCIYFFFFRLIIKVSATKEVFIKLFQVIGRSSIFTKEVHEWFLMESTHNYIRCSSHMVSMNQRSLLETCSESHLSFHIGMVNTVFCIWDTHLFFCYLVADRVLIYFFYEKINVHSSMFTLRRIEERWLMWQREGGTGSTGWKKLSVGKI